VEFLEARRMGAKNMERVNPLHGGAGRKPKFRVGQVVCVRQGYIGSGRFGTVAAYRQAKENLEVCFSVSGLGDWYAEFELRPLTRREKGHAWYTEVKQ
jgi:hypothetical protein